jgi:hypothetical protein
VTELIRLDHPSLAQISRPDDIAPILHRRNPRPFAVSATYIGRFTSRGPLPAHSFESVITLPNRNHHQDFSRRLLGPGFLLLTLPLSNGVDYGQKSTLQSRWAHLVGASATSSQASDIVPILSTGHDP